MDRFFISLENLQANLQRTHSSSAVYKFTRGDRQKLTAQIENIAYSLIVSIAKNEAPYFDTSVAGDCSRIISFGREVSRKKFCVVVYILSKIHNLLVQNKTSTKRELYYDNVNQFDNQQEVDRALRHICEILHIPIWHLRIYGTPKGLIAGPVTFHLDDDEIVVSNPVDIPQNLLDVRRITSPAKWVLVIEKDAAFHKLIQDNILSSLGPCLFVTGKGFPDVSTRILVCRLWDELKIPILCLVDADPHGINIMLVYRFISQSLAEHSHQLCCPAVRWLGVHPSDISRLRIENQPLTTEDKSLLRSMLQRPYLSGLPSIRDEINILLERGVKAEMEGVAKFSSSYLANNYIPSKILAAEYL